MTSRPSVLCPVDFSDASRGALRYAAALAEYLKVKLTVVTVTDPLLTEAAELSPAVAHLPETVRKELYRFCEDTFDHAVGCKGIRFEVATGKPAVEILRLAHDGPATVIVMSTHGLTGVRKLFFGSTTEWVLREATVPVLLTPAHDHGPTRFDELPSSQRDPRRISQHPACVPDQLLRRASCPDADVDFRHRTCR